MLTAYLPLDAHIDPLYKAYTSVKKDCHRGSGKAGFWGAPGTRCDGSLKLIDATFAWIREHLIDDIDFVIWTGDAARHDNDDKHPRTSEQIVELNEILVDRVLRTLSVDQLANGVDGDDDDGAFRGKKKAKEGLQIPFVPNLGNNDFMPHNIFEDGPNKWTHEMSDVWERFIPEEQRHTFAHSGSFYVEVIPDKLAVVSVNSMYFFDMNAAADGCYDSHEPGYRQMEWLRVTLEHFRERNMKAILIGHVPPARAGKREDWNETCWQKYTLWLQRFRDVIVGNMFGHMNIDHFQLHDFEELRIGPDASANVAADAGAAATQDSKVPGTEKVKTKGLPKKISYLKSMRAQWAKLPSLSKQKRMSEELQCPESHGRSNISTSMKGKKKGQKKHRDVWGERYGLSLVSPSIIPTYFPSIRVFSYNISGLEDAPVWTDKSIDSMSPEWRTNNDHDGVDAEKKKKKGHKGKKKRPPPFNVPRAPSPTSLPGPAYSNQPLSLVSYTQYHANLTKLNAQMADSATDNKDAGRPTGGTFEYTVFYNTNDDIYRMEDLTVPSYLKLARRMADGSQKPRKKKGKGKGQEAGVYGKGSDGDHAEDKTWQTFLRRAFTGLYDDEELSR